MPEDLSRRFPQDKASSAILREITGRTEWLTFSDTILMFQQIVEDNSDARYFQWTIFLLTAIHLQNKLFEFGLPLRGVIHFGKYLVKETTFAGRAIVEAYRVAQSLDLAGCGVTREAIGDISTTLSSGQELKTDPVFGPMLVSYLSPVKQGQPIKMHFVNHLGNKKMLDIRQYVLQSFWKHGKDITPEAESKVNNTELFFRFLVSRPG